MDRNSVLGLILIAVILVVFSIMNAPDEAEKKELARRDSIQRATQLKDTAALKVEDDQPKTNVAVISPSIDTTIGTNDTISDVALDSLKNVLANQAAKEQFGIFAGASTGESGYYFLENDKIRATFSSKGGRLVSVELKEFQTYNDYKDNETGTKKPLRLFDEDSTNLGVSFSVNNEQYIALNDLFLATDAPEIVMADKDSAAIAFRLNADESGKYMELVYSLKPGSYVMDFHVNLVGLEKENIAQSLQMNWSMKMLSTEKLIDAERQISSIFYKYHEETRDYLSEMASEKAKMETTVDWVAFKQSYFSTIILSDNGFPKEGSDVEIVVYPSDKYIKEYRTNLNISTQDAATVNIPLKLYFGPNDYTEFRNLGMGTDKIINLGWGIFGWVNKWLVIPVFNVLESIGLNYGLIILLLTIIVKILIMPLTYKNYKSSAKMRVLKPEVDEIGKKYPDEPMKKQQEVMALYRRSGVNPMAGCIPLLIQMPVLIAVFRFFPSAIQLRQEKFLWAEDLSAYDSVMDLGFHIPAYGDHVSLFTLLMCVSTILITRMNSGQMDNGMPGMKFMMYFFPVMMLFFFNNFASGLTYYYFISNLLSLVIMWAIKKYFIDEKRLLAQIHENRKKPQTAKKSAFMQKLEDAAKQRQQQQMNKGKKKK
jgi:YidC/Oxa1 family membrane protein insertase